MTFDELQSKSYLEMKGSGRAGMCPMVGCVEGCARRHACMHALEAGMGLAVLRPPRSPAGTPSQSDFTTLPVLPRTRPSTPAGRTARRASRACHLAPTKWTDSALSPPAST